MNNLDALPLLSCFKLIEDVDDDDDDDDNDEEECGGRSGWPKLCDAAVMSSKGLERLSTSAAIFLSTTVLFLLLPTCCFLVLLIPSSPPVAVVDCF